VSSPAIRSLCSRDATITVPEISGSDRLVISINDDREGEMMLEEELSAQ
jgi:hypothetical protein